MANPEDQPDFTACPHWGQGGRYIYNPETGQRTRIPDEPEAGADDFGTEKFSPGTGEVMVPVDGDTLTAQKTPLKKGK